MVRTSCVTPLKPLAIALWLTLTEQVKQLVELNQFLRWITRANDDQP
jgi:hypothetical protein